MTGDQLSENAMMLVIVRMGRKGTITTHGCRACFGLGRWKSPASRGSSPS